MCVCGYVGVYSYLNVKYVNIHTYTHDTRDVVEFYGFCISFSSSSLTFFLYVLFHLFLHFMHISLAPQCSFHSHNRIAKHCEFSLNPRALQYIQFQKRLSIVIVNRVWMHTHTQTLTHSLTCSNTHTYSNNKKKIQMAIIGYCQF